MKKVQKGHVTLKWFGLHCDKTLRSAPILTMDSSWDLGGQPRFRTMWDRYCQGVNAVVSVIVLPFMNAHAKTAFQICRGLDGSASTTGYVNSRTLS